MTLSVSANTIPWPQDISINIYKHWEAHALQSSDVRSRHVKRKDLGAGERPEAF